MIFSISKESEFVYDQRDLRRGIQTKDYITLDEYLRRLELINEAIYETLVERDSFFQSEEYRGKVRKYRVSEGNLDDCIDAVLVTGTYARSHPDFNNKMWVHKANPQRPPSDLDIVLLLGNYPSELISVYDAEFLNKELALIEKLEFEKANEVALHHPIRGFVLALREKLQQEKPDEKKKLDIFNVDARLGVYFGAINVFHESSMRADFAEEGKETQLIGLGLLYITPTITNEYRSKILSELHKYSARVPFVTMGDPRSARRGQ